MENPYISLHRALEFGEREEIGLEDFFFLPFQDEFVRISYKLVFASFSPLQVLCILAKL